MTNLNKTLGLVLALGLGLTSCEKQDDNIIDIAPEQTKEIVFDFNPNSTSSKSAQDLNQNELVMTYDQGLAALESLQSQDDFFNNGAINNAIAYMNSRFNLLTSGQLEESTLQTLRNNLDAVVNEVDANIELFRESLTTGIIPDEIKPLDETPFRMFEEVSTEMNGTVVTLEGIEIVQKYTKQGSADFYTYKFVVIGENVELLPSAEITWETGKTNTKLVKPNKSITAINDGYVDQVGVEFEVDFVGVTEIFKF